MRKKIKDMSLEFLKKLGIYRIDRYIIGKFLSTYFFLILIIITIAIIFDYNEKKPQSFHGTGDIFAAAFTGSLMQEKSKPEAVKIAADFTCRCIENTAANPAHWYGVKFETALPELIRMLAL